MELYLLRHAIAEERDSMKYKNDAKRPLTEEGIKKMRQAAKGASQLGLSFDLILSSPYERAKQTAILFAKAFKMADSVKYSSNLEPSTSFKRLISELNHKYAAYSQIVLVGHEPYLSGFLSFLLSGHQQTEVEFKKGGLAKLSIDKLVQSQCARLNWLLTPKQLRGLA